MCANHDLLPPSPSSRRGFLFTLGVALSTVATALAGIPIIGYIFGPVRRSAGPSLRRGLRRRHARRRAAHCYRPSPTRCAIRSSA